ncbi:sigma-70 family RNA polymerase sigma factor [bacterium]|nr:sigma-70 family RNA polymerase sigma factor [bacterium]
MSEDPRLVELLHSRDRLTWNRFVEQHAGDLFALVCHLVSGNRSLAEDLHQETWLEALEHAETFDADRGDFRGWMVGIARRRVALHYRKAISMNTAMERKATNDELGPILPDDVVAGVEVGHAIRAAILCLTPVQQEMIAEKYFDQRSIQDIARRTGRTSKSVEGILARAREQLRRHLRPFAISTKKEVSS